MSDKNCYTHSTQEERETTLPSELSKFHPSVIALVRFLAKKAAESDYQELLNSVQTIHPDTDKD